MTIAAALQTTEPVEHLVAYFAFVFVSFARGFALGSLSRTGSSSGRLKSILIQIQWRSVYDSNRLGRRI